MDGVFDMLHVGHARALAHCATLAPEVELVVGVIGDAAAASYKRLPLIPQQDRAEMVGHLRCVHEPEKAGTGLLSERIPLPIAPTHSLVVRTVATAAVALALDAQRVETVRAVVEEAVDTATNNSENEDDEVALAALLQGDIKIHRCNRESKRKRLVGPNIKKLNQRLIKSHGHLFASVCC